MHEGDEVHDPAWVLVYTVHSSRHGIGWLVMYSLRCDTVDPDSGHRITHQFANDTVDRVMTIVQTGDRNQSVWAVGDGC